MVLSPVVVIVCNTFIHTYTPLLVLECYFNIEQHPTLHLQKVQLFILYMVCQFIYIYIVCMNIEKTGQWKSTLIYHDVVCVV